MLRAANWGQWDSRYESLRAAAMPAGDMARAGWGLALFMRRGTVAWMEAWPAVEEARDEAIGGRDGAASLPAMPGAVPKELVLVLAGMIASRFQEVAA